MKCPFVMMWGQLKGQVCGENVIGQHEYCKYHSSLVERKQFGLGNPRWAVSIRPLSSDSNVHYNNFPKELYAEYHHYTIAIENGYPWEGEYESDKYVPYDYGIDNLDRSKLQMPDYGCRYKITEGRYRGIYCCQVNEYRSDYCKFHTSVVKLGRIQPSGRPVPIWVRCIYPTEIDSKRDVTECSWMKYDIADLLCFNLDGCH